MPTVLPVSSQFSQYFHLLCCNYFIHYYDHLLSTWLSFLLFHLSGDFLLIELVNNLKWVIKWSIHSNRALYIGKRWSEWMLMNSWMTLVALPPASFQRHWPWVGSLWQEGIEAFFFFVSFDYWPLLLSKTVEKGSWKQALVDDKAFSVLHWEDSEQNADDFRLLPASLQETDLQG